MTFRPLVTAARAPGVSSTEISGCTSTDTFSSRGRSAKMRAGWRPSQPQSWMDYRSPITMRRSRLMSPSCGPLPNCRATFELLGSYTMLRRTDRDRRFSGRAARGCRLNRSGNCEQSLRHLKGNDRAFNKYRCQPSRDPVQLAAEFYLLIAHPLDDGGCLTTSSNQPDRS